MKNIDKLLKDAAKSTQPNAANIDVRARVLETLSSRTTPTRLDVMPIVVTGVTIALALILAFVFFPEWQTISDPWTCLSSR